MGRYILKRLLWLIPVLIGVTFIVFFITDLAPGDAVDIIAGPETTEEMKAAMREEMGLNRSVFARYGTYIWNFLHGDLGKSYITKFDVWDSYIQRFPATLSLAFWSIFIAALISIPCGIFSAKHHGTLLDSASMLIALLGLSIPGFFLGLILIIVFSLWLGWLPSSGNTGWYSVILPAFSSAAICLATMTRTTRSSMLDALSMDYLDLARSKGVSEKKVVNKHALKNALIPIVCIVGSEFAASLGGATVIEKLFAWPGVGAFTIDAVANRDIPVVCGCISLTTMLIAIVQLLVDILYAVIDPRVKEQYAKKKRKKIRKEA